MTLTSTTRTLLTAALLGGAALLTGCAGLNNVTADVSSFGSWPAARKPGTYAFERLPSQKAHPLEQDALEQAAIPAIEGAGFIPEAADKAEVLIQVSAQTQVRPSPYDDPYGPRFGIGWGMGSWSRYGGVGLGMSMEPPWWQLQVDVLIRDRASHEILFETHARHERAGSVEGLAAPLFRAAMTDFPLPAVSPRPVTVEIKPKQ